MADNLRLRVVLDMAERVVAPLKKINAASQETANALKGAKDKLKELEKAHSDAKGFQRTSAALRSNQRELTQAQAKAAQYGAALQEQRERHANITASLRAAKHGYNQITTAYQDGKIKGAEYTRQIELARITLLRSQQAHEKSLASVNRYKAQVKNAGERVAGLNQSIAGGTERLAGYKMRLEAAGISTERLAAQKRGLKSQMDAANTAIDAQKQKLQALGRVQDLRAKLAERHGQAMMRLAKWGGAGALMQMGGQKVNSAMTKPVQTYADAEEAQTQLRISFMQKDGSVAPEYQQILDKAKELGNRLPGTTADFIRMMTVLRQEGMSAKAVLGGLGDAAANLGVLLGTGPEEAATKMAKMQDSLRATEDEMGKVADLMQRAKYLGADMDFMQSAIGNAAPVMDVMKIQGAQAMQTIAPMAVMMNQAGMEDGGSVGNAVRKIYDRAMNSKKVGKANRELENAGAGFKLDFTDGRGEFGGLENLFDQLAKLRKLSTTDRGMVINALWGDDAETTRVLSKWIDSNLDGYRQTVEKMQAQADLQQRVNEQLGTLKNVTDAAAGSYSNLLTELGASIAPELKAIITWLGEMAVGMGGWARENPKTTRAIMLTVAALGVLLTVAGAITMAIVAVLGPMTAARFLLGKWALGLLASRAAATGAASSMGLLARAFSLVKPAVMGAGRAVLWLGRALLATPWGRVLSLLAFSATMVYNNWEGIKGGLVAIWDGITGRISEAISGGVGSWLALLLDFSPIGILHSVMAFGLDALGIELPARFSTLGGNLIRGLVGGITRALGWLNDTAAGLWNGLVSTAASVWGRITESISGLIDGGVAAWAARLLNFSPLGILWAGITAALTALGISVPAQFHSLGGFVVDGLIGGITSRAAALRDAVTGIASSAAEWFKEKLGIASPSRVFMEYGGWISEGAALGMQGGAGAVRTAALAVAAAAALPMQAAAARSAAGVAVGTPGAALRMDTRPPLAMPAAQAAQPAAGGGTYNITINAAPGMDEKALARAVAAEVQRIERAKRSRVLSAMSDID